MGRNPQKRFKGFYGHLSASGNISSWLHGKETKEGKMKFTIKVWIVTITIDLLDLSDRNVGIGITIAW